MLKKANFLGSWWNCLVVDSCVQFWGRVHWLLYWVCRPGVRFLDHWNGVCGSPWWSVIIWSLIQTVISWVLRHYLSGCQETTAYVWHASLIYATSCLIANMRTIVKYLRYFSQTRVNTLHACEFRTWILYSGALMLSRAPSMTALSPYDLKPVILDAVEATISLVAPDGNYILCIM